MSHRPVNININDITLHRYIQYVGISGYVVT